MKRLILGLFLSFSINSLCFGDIHYQGFVFRLADDFDYSTSPATYRQMVNVIGRDTNNTDSIIVIPDSIPISAIKNAPVERTWTNCFKGDSILKEIIFPNKMNDITGCCNDCPNLKRVEFGKNTYTVIKSFGNCANLDTIVGLQYIKNIREYSFNNSSVKKVVLGDENFFIYSCFQNCLKLDTIIITGSLNSSEGSCFMGCPVKSIFFDSNNFVSGTPFQKCDSLNTIIFGNNVTIIGRDFCYGCKQIKNVQFGENVHKICRAAFSNSGIESAILPMRIDSICDYAFYNTPLKYLSFGDSIRVIMNFAFENCDSLKEVTIPESNLLTIFYRAFNNCKKLSKVTWNVKDGIYQNAPTSDYLNNSPFCQCPIDTVYLGENVNLLPSYLFMGINSLSTVYSYKHTAPTLGYSSFYAIGHTCKRTLYIPCAAAKASYRNAWERQDNGTYQVNGFDYYLPMYSFSATPNNSLYGKVSYTETSCQVISLEATPNPGYRFDKWDDGNTENPRTYSYSQTTNLVAEFVADPTSLENVYRIDNTYHKFIHNGSLIIIRDGKQYNSLGIEL